MPKLYKIDINILHQILYYYYVEGVQYVDLEIFEVENRLRFSPSNMDEQELEIKAEDLA